MDAIDIIKRFSQEFIDCAERVGIDGQQLIANLPPSGTLLCGKSVPVIDKKYQNSCSVLFYINHLKAGNTWPYIRFHTFKHGGVQTEFNGRHLLKQSTHTQVSRPAASQYKVHVNKKSANQIDDSWRLNNFWSQAKHYFAGHTLTADHPWIHKRLMGLANRLLLSRCSIRANTQGKLFAPLVTIDQGIIGYHAIKQGPMRDQKRHYIAAAGLLKGATIKIEANPVSPSKKIAICEGLATGLSIAIFWSGPIYVALTANNLKQVRQCFPDSLSVRFFADNDQWKPQVGNVGINAAQQAKCPFDIVTWPSFGSSLDYKKPTDYNDLLILEGKNALKQQITMGDSKAHKFV